jgi:hypothetical protein
MVQFLRSRVDLWARLIGFWIIFTMILKPTLRIAELTRKRAPLLSLSLASWADEKLGAAIKFFGHKEGSVWWNS